VSDAPDPRVFYAERIPAQWNAALASQQARGESGRRLYDDLCAVDATIRVDVEGEGGGRFFLNVASGRMTSGESAAHPPFLTLVQDRRAFERLVSEAGDSAMAMLGGLSGLAGEMHLTRSRLDNLSQIRGLVLFEVTGDEGFRLRTHFGPDPMPEQPTTTIRVDPDAYRELRSGELDPQTAFLNHRIVVEGDMQVAMQLALAAISPD
jgi:hypothetical protein